MGIKGEWILENRFFLCREADGDWTLSDMSFALKSPSGNTCFGFRAESLAGAMGVTADRLFELNRSAELSIDAKPVPSTDGYPIAAQFTFSIPGALSVLTANCTYFHGNA